MLGDKTFFNEAFREAQSARSKFPMPNANMAALTEEVGELAKAIMEKPESDVYQEAVQVAAMACRIAIEGDPTLNPVRVKRGQRVFP